MGKLEVRQSQAGWYVELDGRFVIGFVGPYAALSALLALSDSHTPVPSTDTEAKEEKPARRWRTPLRLRDRVRRSWSGE
jgi:hypothetical protein